MDLITGPPAAAGWSAACRLQGGQVGLVPTMGALHQGHIALIHRALDTCDRVICSIFVNPLQFNDPQDLARYPRRLEADMALLRAAGCHAVFAPAAEDIFRGHVPVDYDLGGLDGHWEGPSRPGHFQGVVNVVERLFHYTRPDRAFFGEKDRQQLAIVRHVAHALHWPEQIVPCPTLREADGLAMSSRNARLDPTERAAAPVLHRALRAMQELAFTAPPEEAIARGRAVLGTEPAVEPDYIGLAHEHDLRPVRAWAGLDSAVALIAARVGPVRLIDNITLHRPPSA
ncbi:MAG: pantoate--beta-alanine ligase [Flavobacteriales bacterium]|jgi:pantoate--beta-alanine ligase|nr:pantoate--beta-alanine ligase [Flavobacteriales bacterium]